MFGFSLLLGVGRVFVRRHAELPADTLVGALPAFPLGVCPLVLGTRCFNVRQIESVPFGGVLTVSDVVVCSR